MLEYILLSAILLVGILNLILTVYFKVLDWMTIIDDTETQFPMQPQQQTSVQKSEDNPTKFEYYSSKAHDKRLAKEILTRRKRQRHKGLYY